MLTYFLLNWNETCICFSNINNRKVGQVCLIIRNFTKLNLLKLYSVPQSSGLKARYSWSFQPESIAEFSWCLCGQIDVENPNKVTLLNGASLFSKNKKNVWSPIVPGYLVLFIWKVTGKWNRSGSSEDYDSYFALCCSVHFCTSARAGVEHCTSGW